MGFLKIAKTNKKELVINIDDKNQLIFINTIKKKINFIGLQIFLKQKSIHIILKGPRERISYAIQLIKKIQKEMKPIDN